MDTVVPCMHISAPYLTDPREKALYILRHFTSIPSGISITFKEEAISMQLLRAQYGEDAITMANMTSDALTTTYKKIFPGYIVTVDCTPVFIDDIRYNIQIDVNLSSNDVIVDLSGIILISTEGQLSFSLNGGN